MRRGREQSGGKRRRPRRARVGGKTDDYKITPLPGTKRMAAPLGCMRRSSERDPDGVAVGLAEHFSMYCAGAGLIAFVLYHSMQPTRVVNPGLAAYKPPPRTVITYAAPLKFEREAITPAALAAPELETVGASAAVAASAPQLPEVTKAKPQVKAQRPPRARPLRPQQPEHPTSYAYQPSFEGYRPMY